jgi:pyruvate dehydrogenase E2 component (dihydrolipoamide acetyltransferase)
VAGRAAVPAARPGAAATSAAETAGAARVRVLATPPVRRLARDLGVDLAAVRPTGPGGTIARADVTAAAELATQPDRRQGGNVEPDGGGSGTATPRPGDRIPVRGVARQMALAMERSAFTVPQATVQRTVDVTALLVLVARWRAAGDAAAGRGATAPPRVTPLAFVARAVVAALVAHPLVNARWSTQPDGSSAIEVYPAVNLGVAVAADRGLVVPVVPNAERLSLPALAGELAGLVADARAGRTAPARMRGGTITVSNVGVFGVESAAGLVREGEAALVVLGAIRDAAGVAAGQVVVRRVMTVSVSFDHRILDGEAAARYLGEIAAVLTDPTRLLLLG